MLKSFKTNFLAKCKFSFFKYKKLIKKTFSTGLVQVLLSLK